MISETKIDKSFLVSHFCLTVIKMRVEECCMWEKKFLATEKAPLESLYIELNIRNTKRLLNCPYKLHKNMIELHLGGLNEYLDIYSSNYEDIVILGDFNVSVKKNHMKCFCGNYGLKTLTHSFPLHRKFFWSFQGVEKGCTGNECVNKKTPMLSKFWNSKFAVFKAHVR